MEKRDKRRRKRHKRVPRRQLVKNKVGIPMQSERPPYWHRYSDDNERD